MKTFSSLTDWLHGTTFYKEYISTWPAPLNNASFDMFLILFIIAILILPEVIDRVRNHIAARRIRRKNLALQEQRIDDRMYKKKEEDLMSQYIRFMMIANMRQVGMNVSFEDFKEAKAQETVAMPEETPSVEEKPKKKFLSIKPKEKPVKEEEKIEEQVLEPEIKEEPVLTDEDILPSEPVASELVDEDPEVVAPEEAEEIELEEVPEEEDIELEEIKEEEVVIKEEEILPQTELSDLEEETELEELPEEFKEEEPELEEIVEEKTLSNIEEILAMKPDDEPISITRQEMSEFDMLLGRIKQNSANKERNAKYETEKENRIRENSSITEQKIKSVLAEQEEVKVVKKTGVSSKQLDSAKQAALEARRKAEEKERKRKEKLEKRKKK